MNVTKMNDFLDAAIRGDVLIQKVDITPPYDRGPAKGLGGGIVVLVEVTDYFKEFPRGRHVLRKDRYVMDKTGTVPTVLERWGRWEEAADVLPALTPSAMEAWEKSEAHKILLEHGKDAKWLRTVSGKLVPRNRKALEVVTRKPEIYKTFRPWL